MNRVANRPGPVDQLLAWLSARGQVSRTSVDRACRVIADRSGWMLPGDRSPTHRCISTLVRLAHVEAVSGGFSVVPSSLLWSSQAEQGVLLGMRDEKLRTSLERYLAISARGALWPSTWTIAGDRATAAAFMAERGIVLIDDPGLRLLAALPTLEEAIIAWPPAASPLGSVPSEVVADARLGHWVPLADLSVEVGLVRAVGVRGRGWTILRGGSPRHLDTSERRAVGWWAELARVGRPPIGYHRPSGRLRLPASYLPPPVLIERPLIWASGQPPERQDRRWIYQAIDHDRAIEVGRILGLPVNEETS